MADIECKVCGEPWGIHYGTSDMYPWEYALFKQGAGCPTCEGRGNVNDSVKFASQLARVSDECPLEILHESMQAPKWEEPKPTLAPHKCEGCGCQAGQHHESSEREEGPYWHAEPRKARAYLISDLDPEEYTAEDLADTSFETVADIDGGTTVLCERCTVECQRCNNNLSIDQACVLEDSDYLLAYPDWYCPECACEQRWENDRDHDCDYIGENLEHIPYVDAEYIVVVTYSDGSKSTLGRDTINTHEIWESGLRDILESSDTYSEYTHTFTILAYDNGSALLVPSSNRLVVVSARIYDGSEFFEVGSMLDELD